MKSQIIIFSDGGARGNPGPAAFGYILKLKTENEKLKTISEGSKYIGEATNNQAEYQGVLAALQEVKKLIVNSQWQIDEVICFLDSQLIVEQMSGNYKVKNEGLKPLYWQIRELILDLGVNIRFEHITRDKNEEADKLVNEAIDKHLAKP
ncbi:MAG: ribonuclease HI family protein [Patescibacteria group bacterium]|nr:ribonuclease HI family protein [Patescibacteria group bacterium]